MVLLAFIAFASGSTLVTAVSWLLGVLGIIWNFPAMFMHLLSLLQL